LALDFPCKSTGKIFLAKSHPSKNISNIVDLILARITRASAQAQDSKVEKKALNKKLQ
jgi:hypothetical protein